MSMNFYVVAETLEDAISAMDYLSKWKLFTEALRAAKRDGRLKLKVFAVSISEATEPPK